MTGVAASAPGRRAQELARSLDAPRQSFPLPRFPLSDEDFQRPLRVELVTDPNRLAALRASWSALAERSSRPSVFLTHEWFEAAWQWRQQTARLYLICLFRGTTLTAVLPLVLAHREASGPRTLEFLTVPDTQRCDAVVSASDRAPAAAAFADELVRRRSDWDLLRLEYLDAEGVAANELRAALGECGCPLRMNESGGNAYVSLQSTWEDYYAARGRSLKKACNLSSNRLKKLGTVQVEWIGPGERTLSEMDPVLREVIDVSARSWKSRTGNSLDHPGPHAFIERLSRLAHERDWLSLWLLRIDGRLVAMEYQLVAHGEVFALRSDFDAEFEDASPGNHLNRQLIEKLIGQHLTRYYMGPGTNAYKRRWTDTLEPVHELNVFAPTLRARLLAAWALALKPAARRIRDRVTSRRKSTDGADDAD